MQRRGGRLRAGIKVLVVFILAAGTFLGGGVIADRRTEKAVREAEEAADAARRAEKQAKRELDVMTAIWRGLPPPPDEDGKQPKANGGPNLPVP